MRVYRVVITAQQSIWMPEKVIIFISKNYLLEQKVQNFIWLQVEVSNQAEIMTKNIRLNQRLGVYNLLKWLSPTSFALISGNKFKLENINRSKVTISKIN